MLYYMFENEERVDVENGSVGNVKLDKKHCLGDLV